MVTAAGTARHAQWASPSPKKCLPRCPPRSAFSRTFLFSFLFLLRSVVRAPPEKGNGEESRAEAQERLFVLEAGAGPLTRRGGGRPRGWPPGPRAAAAARAVRCRRRRPIAARRPHTYRPPVVTDGGNKGGAARHGGKRAWHAAGSSLELCGEKNGSEVPPPHFFMFKTQLRPARARAHTWPQKACPPRQNG